MLNSDGCEGISMLSSLVVDTLCVLIFIMASTNHDGGLTSGGMFNCSLFNPVTLSFEINYAFSFALSTASYGISHAKLASGSVGAKTSMYWQLVNDWTTSHSHVYHHHHISSPHKWTLYLQQKQHLLGNQHGLVCSLLIDLPHKMLGYN